MFVTDYPTQRAAEAAITRAILSGRCASGQAVPAFNNRDAKVYRAHVRSVAGSTWCL